MPDIRLPNGAILRNVPDGVSQSEVAERAVSEGWATREDFPEGTFDDVPEPKTIQSRMDSKLSESKDPLDTSIADEQPGFIGR